MHSTVTILSCLLLLLTRAIGQVNPPTCHSESCACWWLVIVDDHTAPEMRDTPAGFAYSPLDCILKINVVQGRPSCEGRVVRPFVAGGAVHANGTVSGSARIQILHKNPCSTCDLPVNSTDSCAAWIAGQSAPTITVGAKVEYNGSAYQQAQVMASFRHLTNASQTIQHFIDLSTSSDGEPIPLSLQPPFAWVPLPIPQSASASTPSPVRHYDTVKVELPLKQDQAYTTWEEVLLYGHVTVSLHAESAYLKKSLAASWLKDASHNVEIDFGCRCSGVNHARPIPLVDLGFGGSTSAGGGSGAATGGGGSPPGPPPLGPGPPRGAAALLHWFGGNVPVGLTPVNALGEPIGTAPMTPRWTKGSPYPFTGGRISLHRSQQ